MTVACWCVLVVVLLPYVLSSAARSAVSRRDYVRDPCGYNDCWPDASSRCLSTQP